MGDDRDPVEAVLHLEPRQQRREVARERLEGSARWIEVEPRLEALAVERIHQHAQLLRRSAQTVHEQHGSALPVVRLAEVDAGEPFAREVGELPESPRAGRPPVARVVQILADLALHRPRPQAEVDLLPGRARYEIEDVERLGERSRRRRVAREHDVLALDASRRRRELASVSGQPRPLARIEAPVVIAVLVRSKPIPPRRHEERELAGSHAHEGVQADESIARRPSRTSEHDDQRPLGEGFRDDRSLDARHRAGGGELLLDPEDALHRAAARRENETQQDRHHRTLARARPAHRSHRPGALPSHSGDVRTPGPCPLLLWGRDANPLRAVREAQR